MSEEKKSVVLRGLALEDYDRIVEIDAKVLGRRRLIYYRRKMKMAFDMDQKLVTSLVAEVDGKVVGFIMGAVYIGEYGMFETTATVDTIGVDPDVHHRGVASAMIDEFCKMAVQAGAERIVTQIRWNDVDLIGFFHRQKFTPSRTLILELDISGNLPTTDDGE